MRKKKEKTIKNQFQPNHWFYFILGTILLLLFVTFLVLLLNNKITSISSILAGLFGGVFSSIVLAYLIDKMNCKEKNSTTEHFYQVLWYEFEIYLKHNLDILVSALSRKIDYIDINKEYDLNDILNLFQIIYDRKQFEHIRTNIQSFTEHLIEKFKSIDINLVLYPYYGKINKEIFHLCKALNMNNRASYNFLERSVPFEIIILTLITDLQIIINICKLRNVKIPKILIKEEDKKYIMNFRKAKK